VKGVDMAKTSSTTKYCAMPFRFATFIQTGEQIVCNPTWCDHPPLSGDTVKEKFNSPEIKAIRESILDGSYSYCKDSCPYLRTYREGGEPRIFVEKEMLGEREYPTHIELCEDTVCNLACPTCRNDFIIETTQQRNSFEDVKVFSDKIEFIGATTSGDPLYSKKSFEFLKSLNKKDFPSLKMIKIHTNGLLLMQKWDQIEHLFRDFYVDLNISIDAATKETYSVVRKGGSWDLLLRNLAFINEKTLSSLIIWYCVHDLNYKEMLDCYTLVESIMTKQSPKYNYFTVERWHQDDALLTRQKVDNLLHPEHSQYLKVTEDFREALSDQILEGKVTTNI